MMKNLVLATITLMGVIGLAVSLRAVESKDSSSLNLNQVQTVSTKTYPTKITQNRAWFVEMVLPTK